MRPLARYRTKHISLSVRQAHLSQGKQQPKAVMQAGDVRSEALPAPTVTRPGLGKAARKSNPMQVQLTWTASRREGESPGCRADRTAAPDGRGDPERNQQPRLSPTP